MKKQLIPIAGALVLVWILPALAHAERSFSTAPNAKHQQECGSCHVPYPPGLLPAVSWHQVMQNLNQDFGTDASLDDATARDISQWLQVNAGSGRRGGEPAAKGRITKTNWFVRAHDEVYPSVWTRASVGSASNCSACHADAAKGNFNEHQVHIPK